MRPEEDQVPFTYCSKFGDPSYTNILFHVPKIWRPPRVMNVIGLLDLSAPNADNVKQTYTIQSLLSQNVKFHYCLLGCVSDGND